MSGADTAASSSSARGSHGSASGTPDFTPTCLRNGDARGYREGDTLHFQGSGANRRVVERFTRVGENTIDWGRTVEDDTALSGPWSATLLFTRADGSLYEYACHERNDGMENLLGSARIVEHEANASGR